MTFGEAMSKPFKDEPIEGLGYLILGVEQVPHSKLVFVVHQLGMLVSGGRTLVLSLL